MNYIKKNLPRLAECQVLVVGSGPAGICAAVAAARMGADVLLVERGGCVGGNLTVGHIGPIMGRIAPGTLRDEVVQLLGVGNSGVMHDVELAKIRLTQWLEDADVRLLLQTHILDSIVEDGCITGVVVLLPTGLAYITARQVIDATGDGMVSAMAKVPFEIGRDDGLTQPATIMFTLSGIDPASTIHCCHEEDDTDLSGRSYLQLCRDSSKNGELPPNVSIVRLYKTMRPDERMINATQENGVNGLDVWDVTKAQLFLRQQQEQVHVFLKKYVPGFENSYIRDSSDFATFRETRRIEGEYQLTAEDILAGRRFADVVVHKANFCIDIHNPAGGGQAESEGCPPPAQDYDIPYRSLLPIGLENLLLAGRCISGTHRAHASYRVMNICMGMGHAAGVAATLCCQQDTTPRKLEVEQVQKLLIQAGADLFSQ